MEVPRAIQHFQTALDMLPTYTRAWVNLGMALANQGDFRSAVSYYLTALNLNPDAVHIWNYLTTAFCVLQRMDLAEKCEL
mmetsp:Transcript_31559/g.5703  ORF Transcript_31559/g.5703 Transcript_31559/m.5703 type:complete len:80 (+) Transcript_31559:1075-1314(+)